MHILFSVILNDESDDHTDDDDIVMPQSKTLTSDALHTLIGNPDDRPITPLKDTMIYDPVHSSLDFKDGKIL